MILIKIYNIIKKNMIKDIRYVSNTHISDQYLTCYSEKNVV